MLSMRTRAALDRSLFEHIAVNSWSESSIRFVRGSSSRYCATPSHTYRGRGRGSGWYPGTGRMQIGVRVQSVQTKGWGRQDWLPAEARMVGRSGWTPIGGRQNEKSRPVRNSECTRRGARRAEWQQTLLLEGCPACSSWQKEETYLVKGADGGQEDNRSCYTRRRQSTQGRSGERRLLLLLTVVKEGHPRMPLVHHPLVSSTSRIHRQRASRRVKRKESTLACPRCPVLPD